MQELTARQKEILTFIADSVTESGRTPTVREIAHHFSISIGPVQRHLKALQRKWHLTHKPGISRGIDVVSRKPLAAVPLVGRVPAGIPAIPLEMVEDHVHLDRDIVRNGVHFALRVKGDSMTGSGILNGDVVVVRQQADAENGEIVVALVNGEGAVKKLKKTKAGVHLESTNPAYAPLHGDITVIGKVVYLLRSYHGNRFDT